MEACSGSMGSSNLPPDCWCNGPGQLNVIGWMVHVGELQCDLKF